MTTSLIITTYNWPEALDLVLQSVLKQTKLPNEVIVADDGSRRDTKELISKFQNDFPIPLIHSWQEDEGFQVSKSRNKAIFKSKGQYIILIDGDIVLHKSFIADHISFSKKSTFVQGSRVIFDAKKTSDIFKNSQVSFSFFEDGIKNRKNLIRSKFLSRFFSKENTKTRGIKTCNMAFFKEDCLKVNGFNEDFVGWGREDSEFIIRLLNRGILRRNLKFTAIAYHLYHDENSRKMLEENDNLLKNTIKNKLKWCDNGIKKE